MLPGLLTLASLAVLALHPPPAPDDLLATFMVGDEPFQVRLTDPEDIAGARALVAGESEEAIPVGKIVRGYPEVNTGYSWHVDPHRFTWNEYAIARCDGLPSDVERGLLNDRFCPWSARLVKLRQIDEAVTEPPAWPAGTP